MFFKLVATVSDFLTVGTSQGYMHENTLRKNSGWRWPTEKPTVRKSLTVATNLPPTEAALADSVAYVVANVLGLVSKGCHVKKSVRYPFQPLAHKKGAKETGT